MKKTEDECLRDVAEWAQHSLRDGKFYKGLADALEALEAVRKIPVSKS